MKYILMACGIILCGRIYMDSARAGYIDLDGIIRTGWDVTTDVIQGVAGD